MKKLLPVLACLLLIACRGEKKSVDLLKMAPQKASLLLHSPNLKDFYTTTSSLNLVHQNPALFEELQKNLEFLNYAEDTGETLLAFLPQEEKQNFLLLSRKPIKFDATYFEAPKKMELKNQEVQQFNKKNNTYFFTKKSEAFIITNSQEILENYLEINKHQKNSDFVKLSKAADVSKTSLFINHKTANTKLKSWFSNFNIEKFGSWSSFDLEFQEEQILLNGLSLWQENNGIQALFKDVGGSPQKIAEIMPTSAIGYFSFGYLNFETFQRNFRTVYQQEFSDYHQEILENTTEVASLRLQQGKAIVLNSLNPDNLQRIIGRYVSTSKEFRGIPIYEFEKPDIFNESLKPLLSSRDLNFIARLDHFLVFSADLGVLKGIIRNYRNGNTLIAENFYKKASTNFSTRGNMLAVSLPDNLAEEQSSDKFFDEFSPGPYKMVAMQVVTEQNFSHLHGIFQSSGQVSSSQKVIQLSALETEAKISGKPVFFPNHLNGEQDIAVQDINNQLYLFSSKGQLHWKKQLHGPILGEIKVVDLYKNGRYQLAFTTPNRLQVIDRNGNKVNPFPLKFKDEITKPLALFDYDNNKNYRLLITQDNELFMYNGKGQIVRGFTFRKAESSLTQTPKHIRMNNKDYIVFPKANGKLSILSRQGKHRIKVTESFELEEGEWFGNDGNFIAVEDSGNLIKIDQNGHISRETLGLSEEFRLTATSNLRVSLSENKLQIKERKIKLDYGMYTRPQIFLVNNKYYIVLTDIQSEKVYVFDSNAEMLPGFPIYGKSEVDMAAGKKHIPLLLVKGGEKVLLVYHF